MTIYDDNDDDFVIACRKSVKIEHIDVSTLIIVLVKAIRILTEPRQSDVTPHWYVSFPYTFCGRPLAYRGVSLANLVR